MMMIECCWLIDLAAGALAVGNIPNLFIPVGSAKSIYSSDGNCKAWWRLPDQSSAPQKVSRMQADENWTIQIRALQLSGVPIWWWRSCFSGCRISLPAYMLPHSMPSSIPGTANLSNCSADASKAACSRPLSNTSSIPSLLDCSKICSSLALQVSPLLPFLPASEFARLLSPVQSGKPLIDDEAFEEVGWLSTAGASEESDTGGSAVPRRALRQSCITSLAKPFLTIFAKGACKHRQSPLWCARCCLCRYTDVWSHQMQMALHCSSLKEPGWLMHINLQSRADGDAKYGWHRLLPSTIADVDDAVTNISTAMAANMAACLRAWRKSLCLSG